MCWGMKLSAYFEMTNTSPAKFAADLGDVSVSGVVKWLRGDRTPRPDDLRRIYELTNGAVQPNDFVLPAPAPKAERVA